MSIVDYLKRFGFSHFVAAELADSNPNEVTDEYARAFRDGWLACKRGDAEPPAVPDIEAKYAELLYAVECKWPGESRHETALRYIREREAGTLSTGPQSAMLTDAQQAPTALAVP